MSTIGWNDTLRMVLNVNNVILLRIVSCHTYFSVEKLDVLRRGQSSVVWLVRDRKLLVPRFSSVQTEHGVVLECSS